MNYEPVDGGGAYREAMPDRPSWPVRSLGAASTLWEQTLVAIGCAAAVNRAAHFYLKICGVWIAAAARQIATKVCSHSNWRAVLSCAKP
jgi:hypothetical protein